MIWDNSRIRIQFFLRSYSDLDQYKHGSAILVQSLIIFKLCRNRSIHQIKLFHFTEEKKTLVSKWIKFCKNAKFKYHLIPRSRVRGNYIRIRVFKLWKLEKITPQFWFAKKINKKKIIELELEFYRGRARHWLTL